jgi:MFS transporter, DHA2 family, methylenomycin A resistance protein
VSWRAIFFLNIPVGIVALLLLTRAPQSPRRMAPLDVPGQLTAVVALGALTLCIIEGGANGFGTPLVICSLALAAIASAAFLRVQSRSPHPMVSLSLFRSKIVTICMLDGFTVNAVYYGGLFVISLFLQRAVGLSPLGTGLVFVPMAALTSTANLASVRLAARSGPWAPIWTGLPIAAAGTLALAAISSGADRYLVAVALIPLGAGLGLAVPSLTAVLLDALPAAQAGLAAGVLNSSRQIGGAVAVAVFGAMVARSFRTGLRECMLILMIMLLAATAGALLAAREKTSRKS